MARVVKKVICNICKQEVSASNYSKHLRRHEVHPETFKETYKLSHEGLNCQYCNKSCKNKNSLVQHEIRCPLNPNRIETSLSEYFVNHSHTAWNKGLTKETDERVRRNGESVHEAYASGKATGFKGELNPASRPEVRKKISETCLMKSSQGTWHKSLAKDMHYNYKGVDLDGTWELSYAIYLDNKNIRWNRCTERFPYIWEGKVHYYTPDFYLVDLEEYVEIKGYQTTKDLAKWAQFPINKKLNILKEKELSEMGII